MFNISALQHHLSKPSASCHTLICSEICCRTEMFNLVLKWDKSSLKQFSMSQGLAFDIVGNAGNREGRSSEHMTTKYG